MSAEIPRAEGKTRVALQAAADALEEFPDGVFFVDLASLTEAALVLPTVAATLGVREEGGLKTALYIRSEA